MLNQEDSAPAWLQPKFFLGTSLAHKYVAFVHNRGFTQQELAEKCQRMGWDISRDTLAKVEAQTRWLSDFELAFLAEALHVPLDLLLPERGRTIQAVVREFVARLSGGKTED